ncbi:MAG: DivIVA domain-containing protein [Oscillospiraceae bacterium]|nr:DivIVA domain-containing protein [Oscillospiraceae bacterium]
MGLSKKFKKVAIGGYKTEDVNKFYAETKTTHSKLEEENSLLLEEIEKLKSKLSGYEENESFINRTLVNAQKNADLLIREAECKSEIILREAEQKADVKMVEVEQDLKSCKKNVEFMKNQATEFRRSLLNSYKNHVELIRAISINTSDNSTSDGDKKVINICESTIKNTDIEQKELPPSNTKDKKSHPQKQEKKSIIKDKKIKKLDKSPSPPKYTIKSLDKFTNLKFGNAYKVLD